MKGSSNFDEHNIPLLVLKSEKDPVAKFVSRTYEGERVEIKDVTDEKVKDLFLEHLYHMVNPRWTAGIINDFITKTLDPDHH